MTLTEKEKTVIQDLMTQEKSCMTKYQNYETQAKDPVLKNLFSRLAKNEQKHHDTLSQLLSNTVPSCDCNSSEGADFSPKATYGNEKTNADKQTDCFLATDCISSEKLTSTEYNSNIFNFGDSAIRKLLASIQIEEQNHAEMLYKYKTINCMA